MVFLAVLWFGFSETGSLVAVMAVVTPFVTVNMAEGTKAMDKSLMDMGKAFKASKQMMLRKVYIPQLMPYLMSAFRYSFGMTWRSSPWPRPSASSSASATCSSSGSRASTWSRCWRGSCCS